MLSRLFLASFGFVCCLVVTGCGSDLSSLQGTVLVDGQPAPKGLSLEFSPVSGEGSSSYAATTEGGKYEASFTFQQKGIQPGQHIVSLLPGSGGAVESSMPVIGPDGKPVPGTESKPLKFPESYYQEIQRITIEPGANQIDLSLTTAAAAAN